MAADPELARHWLVGIARMTLKGHFRDEARSLRLTARIRDRSLPLRNKVPLRPSTCDARSRLCPRTRPNSCGWSTGSGPRSLSPPRSVGAVARAMARAHSLAVHQGTR